MIHGCICRDKIHCHSLQDVYVELWRSYCIEWRQLVRRPRIRGRTLTPPPIPLRPEQMQRRWITNLRRRRLSTCNHWRLQLPALRWFVGPHESSATGDRLTGNDRVVRTVSRIGIDFAAFTPCQQGCESDQRPPDAKGTEDKKQD
jgi:hypothetical protein